MCKQCPVRIWNRVTVPSPVAPKVGQQREKIYSSPLLVRCRTSRGRVSDRHHLRSICGTTGGGDEPAHSSHAIDLNSEVTLFGVGRFCSALKRWFCFLVFDEVTSAVLVRKLGSRYSYLWRVRALLEFYCSWGNPRSSMLKATAVVVFSQKINCWAAKAYTMPQRWFKTRNFHLYIHWAASLRASCDLSSFRLLNNDWRRDKQATAPHNSLIRLAHVERVDQVNIFCGLIMLWTNLQVKRVIGLLNYVKVQWIHEEVIWKITNELFGLDSFVRAFMVCWNQT